MTALSASQQLTSFGSTIQQCHGYNDFEHRLFLCTNERGQDRVLQLLSKCPIVGNTVVGVSGFLTLNMAAARGSQAVNGDREIEHIILLDRSLLVEHFWKNMKAIMACTNDRKQVIHHIITFVMQNAKAYYANPPKWWKMNSEEVANSNIQLLEAEIKEGLSWLSDDIKFERIAKIFRNQRFDFFRIDLCAHNAVWSLVQEMDLYGKTKDLFYDSNCDEYTTDFGLLFSYRKSKEMLTKGHCFYVHAIERIDPTIANGDSQLVLECEEIRPLTEEKGEKIDRQETNRTPQGSFRDAVGKRRSLRIAQKVQSLNPKKAKQQVGG